MKSSRKDERLDQEMVRRGIVESRNRAQSLLLAGMVRVNGEKVLKPGTKVSPASLIEIDGKLMCVSRGAHKLLKALDVFHIDP